ncbi:MAG TPA: tetratricopeptide repeat protein [Vicinamibacterales bacterium]|jgi:tetratricopeptide (TPR) repeat protein
MSKHLACVLCVFLAGAGRAAAQSTVAQLGERGWQAVQAGDSDRAVSAFREALTLRPRDAALNLGAGVAAHMQGREDDATTFLQRAVQLDPTLVEASTLLGEIAYRQGNLDLAIKTYEAALTRSPKNPQLKQRLDAWKNEASAYSSFETVKDDRFAVMFEGPVEQKLATHATTVLGNAFWRIGKVIGAYPSNPINVILYTQKQFRDITGAPEWAGGGFDGQIRMPVRGALQNLDEFDRLLTHELTHAILHSVASRNLPAWVNEGIAMYFEGYDAVRVERALAAAHLFVPLSNLRNSYGRLNADQAAVAYAESFFAVSVLLDRIGPTGLGQLLQDLNGGATIEQAVERFGFTFADFEAKLARRVGVQVRATER